ncbi:MAG: NADH-quinone oxidoreductase subunit A, partial [Candidatus Moraniibacteriota bacterium]
MSCEKFHDLRQRWIASLNSYIPILIYSFAVLGFAAVSLLLPHLVAPRKKTPIKDMPYESGMDPVGDARKPLDIKFYLIAILFLLFDVELLFLYPWAVANRSIVTPETKFGILIALLSLSGTLFLAYVYAWKKGVFQ